MACYVGCVVLRLILLAGLMLGEAPPAARETILWFGAQAPTDLDEGALLQAVAVYTRDLHLSVRAIAGTRIARTPEGAAQAVSLLKDSDAGLAFWCEGTSAAGDVALYTVDAKGSIEAHPIQGTGLGGPELYRAIALKLRSVVAGTEPPPEPVAVPRAAASPGTPPGGAPDARASTKTQQPPVGSAPGATETTGVVDRQASPHPIRSRLSGAVGYRLVVPVGSAPLQQGLALEGTIALSRLELSLGTEIAPAADGQVASGRVSLFDLPVRVGARWVRRRPRLQLAAGAYGALHLLSARATNTAGEAASTFTATAGAGVEVLLRVPFASAIAGELRVFAEEIAPRTVFWVGGTPAIELGAEIGAGLGLAFPGF